MRDATMQVVEENLKLLSDDDDHWVGQRASHGVDLVGGDVWATNDGPTVIIECTPLPLGLRARLYRDGIDVWVPSTRRISPDALSPRGTCMDL